VHVSLEPLPCHGRAGLFQKIKANPVYLFLLVWVSVVFLVFQPAHSKLTSYIFPMFPRWQCWPAIIYLMPCLRARHTRSMRAISVVMCILAAFIPLALLVVALKKLKVSFYAYAGLYIFFLFLVIVSSLWQYLCIKRNCLYYLCPCLSAIFLFVHRIFPYTRTLSRTPPRRR